MLTRYPMCLRRSGVFSIPWWPSTGLSWDFSSASLCRLLGSTGIVTLSDVGQVYIVCTRAWIHLAGWDHSWPYLRNGAFLPFPPIGHLWNVFNASYSCLIVSSCLWNPVSTLVTSECSGLLLLDMTLICIGIQASLIDVHYSEIILLQACRGHLDSKPSIF